MTRTTPSLALLVLSLSLCLPGPSRAWAQAVDPGNGPNDPASLLAHQRALSLALGSLHQGLSQQNNLLAGQGKQQLEKLAEGLLIRQEIFDTGDVLSLVRVTPDGKTIAGACHSVIKCWDRLSRRLTNQLAHGEPIHTLQVLADNRTVVSCSRNLAVCWDLPGGGKRMEVKPRSYAFPADDIFTSMVSDGTGDTIYGGHGVYNTIDAHSKDKVQLARVS